jgi:hypothetical protein
MKWTIKSTILKVALTLGAVASFLMAAGASTKWG